MEARARPTFVIRGTLVSLRTTVESDLTDYERWNDRSRKAWQTDGPWFKSKADEIGLAEWRRSKLASQKPPYPFLEIETTAGIHIGWVIVYYRENDPHMTEVGIDIVEDGYWGKGLGTEALSLWVDYQFRARNLTRIGFATWSGNPAMLRVGEKLGFQTEARIRQGCMVNGAFHDRIKMGILRREWERDK
jgi:RimJ/RimL family protein N-acetyltransferase